MSLHDLNAMSAETARAPGGGWNGAAVGIAGTWRLEESGPFNSGNEELRSAALLGRAALGLAHDLNNLLTGTQLYCDLLGEHLGAAHQFAGHVEKIRCTTARASAVATQLLNLGRPAGVGAETCDVAGTITEILDLLTRLVGERIELTYEIQPEVGRAAVEDVKVQRVLLNLVLNAREAMHEGGRIKIRASRLRPDRNGTWSDPSPEGRPILPIVQLEVTDNGPGMDAATCARVLDPFFTTKAGGRRRGLGLSAIQDVAADCGGGIEVRSKPGSGTMIRVWFPGAGDCADGVRI